MPKFGVRVPHTLTQSEARNRLQRFVEILQRDHKVSDLQQSWEGETLRFGFTTYGVRIDGGITVTDEALQLDGNLPFSAMMFRGKIESAIREQLERIVAPAQGP